MKTTNYILPLAAFAAGALFAKSQSAKVSGVFKSFWLKLPGMRKEDDFTIYPYSGGDTATLQSGTRILQLDLRTGKALVSKARSGGAYFVHLNPALGATFIDFPKDKLVEIQGYLWNNAGMHQDSGIVIENKELFSE